MKKRKRIEFGDERREDRSIWRYLGQCSWTKEDADRI